MDEILKTIEESIFYIKEKEDVSVAKELLATINFLLVDKKYQDKFSDLEIYKAIVEIYTFRYLSEEQQLKFFTKGIERVLMAEDINFIIDSVKYFLYDYRAIDDYKTIREQLLQSLYENKEALTTAPVLYKNGKELEGTVKNWFKHYQLQFDHNKEFRIGMMEYLNTSLAIQDLKAKEKEAIKNLIYLIEYLRSDVEEILTQELDLLYDFGDEGSVGYVDGELIDLKPNSLLKSVLNKINELKIKQPKEENKSSVSSSTSQNNNASELSQLKAKVQLSEEEMINFRNIVAKYKALDDQEIMDYFWEGVDIYNKYLIMGALQELVRRKQWDDVWEIPRLRLLLNDYRSRKLKDLSFDPADKKMQLKVLLMFLLEQHLSLPVDNAKKWALYLINALVKNGYSEYQDLIYFDQDQGKLEWEKS